MLSYNHNHRASLELLILQNPSSVPMKPDLDCPLPPATPILLCLNLTPVGTS